MVAGPAAAERVNLTAFTSRICKGKNGLAWLQGDNCILTVIKNQFIVAGDLVDSPCDQGQLHPSLRAARAALDLAGVQQRMRAHLADAGFASIAAFAAEAEAEGILLISPVKEAVQTGRATTTATKIKAGHEKMAARLGNPAGKRLYRRRAGMVEPVFAQLFHHGGRRLHFRDAAKHTEINIMIAAHNAGKYFTYRHNQKPPSRAKPPCLTPT